GRSTRPRITTRTITRRTRCSTASTSPAAAATSGSTAYGASCASTDLGPALLLAREVRVVRNLLRIAQRRVLALDVLLAEALGFLHLVLLAFALRRRLARGVVDLARLHELALALVVLFRAAIAAFAFDLVFALHCRNLLRVDLGLRCNPRAIRR